MNYKLIGVFLGAAFVLYFMVSQPSESFALVHGLASGIGDAAGKMAAFIRGLAR